MKIPMGLLEYALPEFSPREQLIIGLRFREKPSTLKEVGEKLNLTLARVQQIQAKITPKLLALLRKIRPETKPPNITDSLWGKSACPESPTGAHYFRLISKASVVDGPCIYCEQLHSKIHGASTDFRDRWDKRDANLRIK